MTDKTGLLDVERRRGRSAHKTYHHGKRDRRIALKENRGNDVSVTIRAVSVSRRSVNMPACGPSYSHVPGESELPWLTLTDSLVTNLCWRFDFNGEL